ncbi:carboxypeptidase-like regulatory domain-containing protein [uncultured Eudoraea sp.]|uniref:carboxypeptidase-like regulatory domain-containing protein n=1 Tax=uncultured Eudoraea sp. TaxID=1035614 RepID=UPI0026178029|nr:carboxypeptidase-like regulatory domain-containing protein [uncultured Eudoraea sp.]
MKRIFVLIGILLSLQLHSNTSLNEISGIVTIGNSPIQNVCVQVLNSTKETFTDEKGKYLITAKPSDVLAFDYAGMQRVEVVVEDVTARLNIEMKMNIEALKEVVVGENNTRNQDYLRLQYGIDKSILSTAFGYLDAKSVGYSIKLVDGDNLSPGAVDVITALKGRAAGVYSLGGEIYIRGGGPQLQGRAIPAIYDLDGMVLKKLPFITVENIDRVAIISGLAGRVRYGSIARGGVVVINTISSPVRPDSDSNKSFDRARLRNNIYNNDAIAEDRSRATSYLRDLYSCKEKAAAREVYQKYVTRYAKDPYFITDTYLFFHDTGDQVFANQILEDNIEVVESNPVYAKAMAFALDYAQEYAKSKELYKKIFVLRPEYLQSYRDMANSYYALGNYKNAANMYIRYQYLVNEGIFANDSSAIQKVIDGEMNNLFVVHGTRFMAESNIVGLKNYTKNKGETRLFFEWNDSEAEFDLEFVNPQRNNFIWEHSLENAAERIKDEKTLGYSSEEFFVDGSLPGKWQINVKYKGNKKLSPVYMKLTKITNYNTPAQKIDVSVFRLAMKNVKQKLTDFNNVVSFSAN